MTQMVMNTYSGNRKRDILNGLRAFKTTTLVKTKSRAATIAAINGVIIHEKTIDTTPPGNGLPSFGALYQTTESAPAATIDIPTIDPTIVWVVDTGSSRNVARASQSPADKRAQSIPYMRSSGE